ncbi:hypothetical protein [Tenacibaculum litopenaei]|uniref:hypothetical protein n=1 Tax=Tenacibaculum litopenaei TaxID=396016 RepID=UPI0038B48C29
MKDEIEIITLEFFRLPLLENLISPVSKSLIMKLLDVPVSSAIFLAVAQSIGVVIVNFLFKMGGDHWERLPEHEKNTNYKQQTTLTLNGPLNSVRAQQQIRFSLIFSLMEEVVNLPYLFCVSFKKITTF